MRLGRVPKNSKMKKLFAKMKRSRRVHNPRYQELYSALKNKKVVMIWMWEIKPIENSTNYLYLADFPSGPESNLILGLLCRGDPVRAVAAGSPGARISVP